VAYVQVAEMAMIPTKEVKAILYSLVAEKYVTLQVSTLYCQVQCNLYISILGDTSFRGLFEDCLSVFSQFTAIG